MSKEIKPQIALEMLMECYEDISVDSKSFANIKKFMDNFEIVQKAISENILLKNEISQLKAIIEEYRRQIFSIKCIRKNRQIGKRKRTLETKNRPNTRNKRTYTYKT